MDTAGRRPYTLAIASRPVLISAAMARQAKYVDLKGFRVNHLYGTVTTQESASRRATRTPEKNALGSLLNRYSRNKMGLPAILGKGVAMVNTLTFSTSHNSTWLRSRSWKLSRLRIR